MKKISYLRRICGISERFERTQSIDKLVNKIAGNTPRIWESSLEKQLDVSGSRKGMFVFSRYRNSLVSMHGEKLRIQN